MEPTTYGYVVPKNDMGQRAPSSPHQDERAWTLRMVRKARRHLVYMKRDKWTSTSRDLCGMWTCNHFESFGRSPTREKRVSRSLVTVKCGTSDICCVDHARSLSQQRWRADVACHVFPVLITRPSAARLKIDQISCSLKDSQYAGMDQLC